MRKTIAILLLLLATSHVFAKKEIINLNLKLGFIKGGEAQLVINDTTFNGIPAIHYFLLTKTTGLTDKIFDVYDIYETIVDAETKLPLQSIRNIKEKKYRWYNKTLFNHETDSIYSQRSGARAVPDTLLDMLSVFFYIINNTINAETEPGFEATYATFHGDKINDLKIIYRGDEKVETDLGNIDSYVLTAVTDKGKLLNRSDGLRFFISKKYKVPISIEFDMRVGTLRAVLKSHTINGIEQFYP